MRSVYLINLSFGLAGIERRFANIWNSLRARGRVRPVLVVPDTLARQLATAGLVDARHELLWTVPEHPALRALERVPVPAVGGMAVAYVRSRAHARAYNPVWDRIVADPGAVVHIGLNCSSLEPPDVPLVYECVDSTLSQLGTRHYLKAAQRRCIVHCQTDRIRRALEATMVSRSPLWTTVASPCYFAGYPEQLDPPVPRDPGLMAFVGRLSPEKSPVLFIEAVAKVRASGLDVRALVLGVGPMKSALLRRIGELGLSSSVEVGFDQRPARRLLRAAAYVTLQSGDNYGSQSLLEAMGAGCAVIASDVGETRRLVDDRVGLLVGHDVDQLAAAIARLVQHPARTAAMGAAASARVRTEFTADRYVGFLESLYERAAELHNSWPAVR